MQTGCFCFLARNDILILIPKVESEKQGTYIEKYMNHVRKINPKNLRCHMYYSHTVFF